MAGPFVCSGRRLLQPNSAATFPPAESPTEHLTRGFCQDGRRFRSRTLRMHGGSVLSACTLQSQTLPAMFWSWAEGKPRLSPNFGPVFPFLNQSHALNYCTRTPRRYAVRRQQATCGRGQGATGPLPMSPVHQLTSPSGIRACQGPATTTLLPFVMSVAAMPCSWPLLRQTLVLLPPQHLPPP